jgi:hypothetical protein
LISWTAAARAGQQPRELVQAPAPPRLLGVATGVGRDPPVDHQHGGRAVRLPEQQLDELLVGRIVVERPGYEEPVRGIDHLILALHGRLGAVGASHEHADLAAHARIDPGHRVSQSGPQ